MPAKVGFVRRVGVGQVGSLEQVVGPDYAADRFENTGVTVLATPVLCQWFESAAAGPPCGNTTSGRFVCARPRGRVK